MIRADEPPTLEQLCGVRHEQTDEEIAGAVMQWIAVLDQTYGPEEAK